MNLHEKGAVIEGLLEMVNMSFGLPDLALHPLWKDNRQDVTKGDCVNELVGRGIVMEKVV